MQVWGFRGLFLRSRQFWLGELALFGGQKRKWSCLFLIAVRFLFMVSRVFALQFGEIWTFLRKWIFFFFFFFNHKCLYFSPGDQTIGKSLKMGQIWTFVLLVCPCSGEDLFCDFCYSGRVYGVVGWVRYTFLCLKTPLIPWSSWCWAFFIGTLMNCSW